MHIVFLPLLMIAITNPVHVVYVNNPNVDHARREIYRAFSYWHELSPCNPRLSIASEQHIRMDDPYNFFELQKLDRALGGAHKITLFIINNENTHNPVWLGDTFYGFAFNDVHSRVIYTVTHYEDDNDNYYYPFVGMALAHELGHRLYNLPDRHNNELSIMSFPYDAYSQWVMYPEDFKGASKCLG